MGDDITKAKTRNDMKEEENMIRNVNKKENIDKTKKSIFYL